MSDAHIWQASLTTAVLAATPLLYAAIGELLTEKTGVENWGIEGTMLIGAVVGFIAADKSGSALIGLGVGGAAGLVFAIVSFGVPVVVLRANPILVAFAVWFMGVGLSTAIGTNYVNRPLHAGIQPTRIPGLADIPWVGTIFFNQIWPVYAGVVLVVAASMLLGRTRHGLAMRALGEDPASAYASGVPVVRWRLVYTGVGGFFVGVGGAILSVVVTGIWQENMTGFRGWIALALVFFVGWRPLALLLAAYLFGVLIVLGSLGQAEGWPISSEFLNMAPYLFTIVAVTLRTVIELRRGGGSLAPAALGRDFYRGQR